MRTMTRHEFADAMLDDDFRRDYTRASSPGPVADWLGVSRQYVDKLMAKGALDGIRVVNDDGSLSHITIYEATVRKYLRDSKRKAAKRVGKFAALLDL